MSARRAHGCGMQHIFDLADAHLNGGSARSVCVACVGMWERAAVRGVEEWEGSGQEDESDRVCCAAGRGRDGGYLETPIAGGRVAR